jgi:hypothetical protein
LCNLAPRASATKVSNFNQVFPRINDKSLIITIIYRFSMYACFIPIGHPYTTMTITRTFFDMIVCLHGVPNSIVSDRDLVFTERFWRELFTLVSVKL